MRKRLFLGLVALVLGVCPVQAQIVHPVKWSYAAKRVSRGEAVVLLHAAIEDGWHIYSAYQKEGGPVPTSFRFEAKLLGKLSEPAPVRRYEESFGMDVNYFERGVTFQQKVAVDRSVKEIKGSLTFMVCNDQKCLPPETVSFTAKISQ